MEKNWFFVENQFLNVTARNFKKAVKLSNYHDAVLKTLSEQFPLNTELVALYTRYHAAHLLLVAEYNKWKAAGGTQEGQTLNVTQLLSLLLKKVDRWDSQISLVYEKGTPAYKALLPNGHAPFGPPNSIQDRIEAVDALGIAIGTDAALAVTKGEVDTFYDLLNDSRDNQESSKLGKKSGSINVNNARISAMNLQYSDLGYFIYTMFENPAQIEPLFDLETLREGRQTVFTGTLDPAENEGVMIHTFLADDELELEITGTGTVKFYLSNIPNGTPGTGIEVSEADGKVKITAAAFTPADYATYRYLTVQSSSTETLHYKVRLK